MFSILTLTATVATCVWASAVASLFCFKRILSLLSVVTSSQTPAKTSRKERISEDKKKPVGNVPATKDQGNSQNESTGRKEEIGDSPIKIEHIGVSEKVYEEDTEGSDDTVGSYGLLNQYTDKTKTGDLKHAQLNDPAQLSEAERMRMDIERSLM